MTEFEALTKENQTLKDLLKTNRAERDVLDQLFSQNVRDNVVLRTHHALNLEKIEDLTTKKVSLEKELTFVKTRVEEYERKFTNDASITATPLHVISDDACIA